MASKMNTCSGGICRQGMKSTRNTHTHMVPETEHISLNRSLPQNEVYTCVHHPSTKQYPWTCIKPYTYAYHLAESQGGQCVTQFAVVVFNKLQQIGCNYPKINNYDVKYCNFPIMNIPCVECITSLYTPSHFLTS